MCGVCEVEFECEGELRYRVWDTGKNDVKRSMPSDLCCLEVEDDVEVALGAAYTTAINVCVSCLGECGYKPARVCCSKCHRPIHGRPDCMKGRMCGMCMESEQDEESEGVTVTMIFGRGAMVLSWCKECLGG